MTHTGLSNLTTSTTKLKIVAPFSPLFSILVLFFNLLLFLFSETFFWFIKPVMHASVLCFLLSATPLRRTSHPLRVLARCVSSQPDSARNMTTSC